MAEKKAPTAKFVVIMPNTLGHKIGDVITLTKAKSIALVGKVRLLKDVEAAKAAADKVKFAQDETKEVQAALEVAEARIAELEAEIAAK